MKHLGGLILLGTILLTNPAAAHEQQSLSDSELLAKAGDKYANGKLPLGDGHYVLDAPRKGYIYLCHVPPKGRGAGNDVPWISGDSWNMLQKPAVNGAVYWSEAYFTTMPQGKIRVIDGNGLPVNDPTGIFPIGADDPVFAYDRNPGRIAVQSLHEDLPMHPAYTDPPFCMGMEVGYMLSGVPLNAGFDAELRDAAAHEVQDKCSGHPERHGQYHYHSMSACLKNKSIKTVVGFALDGFPITGPYVAPGRYLTTDDLDECHGITSTIMLDGKPVISYHYVLTMDFPYSASCFRSKPVRTGPPQSQTMQIHDGDDITGRMGPRPDDTLNGPPQPPAFAIAACTGRQDGDLCSFISPRGDAVSGTCHIPPMQNAVACIPGRR